MNTITIRELLEFLDGAGLVITDDDLLQTELKNKGYNLDTKITFEN
jgi:hypothetical protein